ncbi:MAG: hypothetical protein ACD_56C00008G0002 [uncultured bacterium]|nr:MAG: hypothetical protein ACD_56C00008G0002 [uncultured bacterium]
MENDSDIEIFNENEAEKKSGLRKFIKITLWILGSLLSLAILIVLFFLIYININKGDIEKIDDLTLAPSSKIVSKENNAFYDFKQAMDNVYWPAGKGEIIIKMAEGSDWDNNLAVELVEKNKIALDFINSGIQKEDFQYPELQGDLRTSLKADTILPNLSKLRDITKIQIIQSRLLMKDGSENEAFNVAFNVLDFGNKIQSENRTTTISYLIGLSIKSMGITNIQRMIPVSHLSANDLKILQDRVDKHKENKKSMQEMVKMEYMTTNNSKEQMIDPYFRKGQGVQLAQSVELSGLLGNPLPINKGLLNFSFYYKPNKTQKLFVDHFEKLAGDSMKNCSEIAPLENVKMSKNTLIFTENAVGKMFSGIIAVSLDGLNKKRCQEDFSLYATQLMFASQAYKLEKGAYPETMNQLNPQYMPNVLTDFDAKQVIYNAQSGTISIAQ